MYIFPSIYDQESSIVWTGIFECAMKWFSEPSKIFFSFFRARVEIKPILYVPSNDDVVVTRGMETGVSVPPLGKAWTDWSALYSELRDSCCQVHTIDGRICSAVVSITNDIASKICSTSGQLYDGENLKIMGRFCAFQIARILADNKFSWDSIMVHLSHIITW